MDPKLVKSCFKISLHKLNISNCCEGGWYRPPFNMSKKHKRRMNKIIDIFYYRVQEYYFSLDLVSVFENKMYLLKQLINSRRICEYPLCNRLCFYPQCTCVDHRYLGIIIKNKIVRPSTKELLDLEKSISRI